MSYRTISSAVTADTDLEYSLVDGQFEGKVRNTFGKYAIYNTEMDQFKILGYNMVDDDNISMDLFYTTPAEDSIQFMGSHEVYWFPYMSFLMARLSDGRSFKFYRFTSDF